MYYFGSSGGPSNVGATSNLYGVDIGYSLELPVVTIRPLVGLGNFTETFTGSRNLQFPPASRAGRPRPA